MKCRPLELIKRSAGPKLNPRRYKTQLRDFLSSCRTKRKPTANDIYADSASYAAFTSPTAPYMGGAIPSYPSAADTLYMQVGEWEIPIEI